jgi:hypothetical protein
MIRSVLVLPGNTLFHISAKYLGDATEWWRVANSNGICDPFIEVPLTVNIPEPSYRARQIDGA